MGTPNDRQGDETARARRNSGEAIRDRSEASAGAGPPKRTSRDRAISGSDNCSKRAPFATGEPPRTEGEGEMSPDGSQEERVIWRKRFQAQHFDFRGKSIFTRFDDCEFVKCTLLVDHETEQLAFTACVFKD